MIKKKNNSYMLIKKNIAKLAIIQHTTDISPNRLVFIFLNYIALEDIMLPKKTKDGYWDWKLADNTAYKYFKEELNSYMKRNKSDPSFIFMQEHFKSNYLTKNYFGETYETLANSYHSQEHLLKDFVKEAFIAAHPITPDMSPKEVAVRNQKLGKISVKHWVGDITNYAYFSQAPDFIMKNVKQALQNIDRYIVNLLSDQHLDQELIKLSTNQRLEVKLIPKTFQAKSKPLKI